MTDTVLTDAAHPMPHITGYPAARDARCPFNPPAEVRTKTSERPVTKVQIWDGSTPWLVTRYADQHALLTDPRLSIDETLPGFPHMTRGRSETAKHTPPLITNTDAPEHTRLRRMVNMPFSVKRVEALRRSIQKIVDDLIDTMLAGNGPVDLVKALGLPVPTLVISELLGVPYDDHEFFQRNSNVTVSHTATEEEVAAASGALAGYLGELIDRKMAEPEDDVLSELAAKVTAGEMARMEAVIMGVAILIAGHETSANMISLGTLVLLQNPDQLDALRGAESPKAVAAAVEELLRYLTIVHTGVRRIALEDIAIGGEVIKAGDGVILDLSAANWDPEEFAEPDRLDLTRSARHHHAFGYGAHQCLGQTLARVELQVVYSTLYRRIPTLRLAVPPDEIEFAFEGVAYGLRSLPVTW
ncbi:cytochrome P450 [Antribacter sp. KLBMP9083]|uniref:Cytochrome P450 n=1 Tax=Antribacter soli TaxID=2910976 RepID=A0AA41QAK6_9MICO|nr:cytochrome P450 [Antribacter soli]MCF4119913.1 cytochrome P450 [Antribacter soli]